VSRKVQIYYDGRRGVLRVTLRGALTALEFDGSGIRTVTEGDAQDLRTPIIGGGSFWPALRLSDAAQKHELRLADVRALADAGAITSHVYQAPKTEEPEIYVVLDTKTVTRLLGAKGAQA
jgi:hypothetical protein